MHDAKCAPVPGQHARLESSDGPLANIVSWLTRGTENSLFLLDQGADSHSLRNSRNPSL